jgi:hypothetical protein
MSRELVVRVSGIPVKVFTPGGSDRIDNCRFVGDAPDGAPCDFWIVMSNPRDRETALVAPCNTLLNIGEPPAKKIYPRRYYGQFAHVVDTHARSRHPGVMVDAICLGWLVGQSYDQLKAMKRPQKSNRVGVVCSSTAKTKGQRRRLAFLHQLKARLGDKIVHYGKGFTPVGDKMDAILPYRFGLALENSQSPNYWTEKLSDVYLGWSFPLYVGCPNVGDYFAKDSFRALDMNDIGGAVRIIEELLATPESDGEISAVRLARERVLEEYNPLRRFAMWANRLHRDAAAEKVVLRTHNAIFPLTGWVNWVRRTIED